MSEQPEPVDCPELVLLSASILLPQEFYFYWLPNSEENRNRFGWRGLEETQADDETTSEETEGRPREAQVSDV